MKQLFTIITLLFSINSFALDVPPLSGPVVDTANALTNDAALESQIRALYNNGQGPQINILVISSLNGENLEQYAHKVFTTWKLGDAKRDDGALFLVVINDRKMRIEVGQGLEGGLTDLQSKRILGSLKSYFRQQDYNGGIQSGLSQIITTVSKPDAVQQPVAPRQAPRHNSVASQESDFDGGLFLGVIMSGLAGLIGFVTIGRVVRNYKRNYNNEYSELESDLTRYQNQEVQAIKHTKKYQDKIEAAEKANHLPLIDATNKLKKERQGLVTVAKKQEESITSLERQSMNCPLAKLESLQHQKSSLTRNLNAVQREITQHQNLINKEGK